VAYVSGIFFGETPNAVRLDSGDSRCYKSPAKEVVECNF